MAIKNNQLVKMAYELKVNDEILESNLGGKPLEFIYGTGELLPGLEAGMKDMNEGETKEIEVLAKDAYGLHDPKQTETLPIKDFDGIDLEIGLILEADTDDGELIKATVTEVTKDSVTVDYNHPLAGSNLYFKVYVEAIV